MLCGCGSVSGNTSTENSTESAVATNDANDSEAVGNAEETPGADSEATQAQNDAEVEGKDQKEDAENNGTTAENASPITESETSDSPDDDSEDYYKGPDENIWDGGPDFTSLATQFNNIFHDITIEEAVEKYSITLVDGGKYADYEGDIGDIIPEYRDVDLDGDRKSDVIRREGSHYVIECSSAGSFETDDFSSAPNEGQIIEFEDTACRNIDEILIAHYTFGTGGPVVWDTAIYSYQKGQWKKYPIIDKDNFINSKELQDYIAKRTGKKYEPYLATVSAIDMTTLLLNFGQKDGPLQINDYEAAYLSKSFDPEYNDGRDDFGYFESHDFMLLLNHWPLEVSGEPIELTSELQYKLNVYLSNFSEQNYRPGVWEATMAHFALEWQKINQSLKPVEKDGNFYYRISHSDINQILGRYFGTNLEEGEICNADVDNIYGGYIEYADEEGIFYCEPAADGEMYANNAFTVVSGAELLGNNYGSSYMRLHFKVYRLDTEDYDKSGIGKQQYSLSSDEAAKLASQNKLYEAYEGSAIVVQFDDEYWLIDYSVPNE